MKNWINSQKTYFSYKNLQMSAQKHNIYMHQPHNSKHSRKKNNNGFNGTFKGQRSENNINLNYGVLGLSSTMGLCSSQMQHASSRHPTDTHFTHSSPPTFANICASAANLLPLRQALVGATPGGRDPTEERVEILRLSARQAKQQPFISFAIVSV